MSVFSSKKTQQGVYAAEEGIKAEGVYGNGNGNA